LATREHISFPGLTVERLCPYQAQRDVKLNLLKSLTITLRDLSQPEESELLVKFEQHNLPEPYKEFYSTKRRNFFASIQGFAALWDCFMLLDKMWVREFEDMRTIREPSRMFPMILFMNTHAKMRIAFELGFSSCLPEAHSILRDAIESVAHGHRLFSDPELTRVWLEKNDSEVGAEAFKKEFWYSKEEKLFDGLDNLLKLWKQFSESGSHTNLNSIVSRFVSEQTDTHVEWRLNYTGVKPELLLAALFEMLLAFHAMEEVLFKNCEGRLKLDHELVAMRDRFARDKEQLRRTIIAKLHLPHPDSDSGKR
jgi:hypothetical protein